MRLVDRPRRKARIEIVPMIDTVFFLLVFFMMSSLSMTVYRGVPIALPKAASGQQLPDETASITVARDGTTYLNKRAIAASDLPAALERLVATAPGLVVIVNADEEVAHRRVVSAMDAARVAGASRIAIAVKPGGERREP